MALTESERLQSSDAPQPPGAKTTGQRARQGQNIKGMLAVLVVGIVLVVIAYSIMLALSSEPAAVTDASRNDAALAPTTQAPPGDSTVAGQPSTPPAQPN